MTLTRQQVMRCAWTIYRDRRFSFSAALKMAWAMSRGLTHAFEVPLEDGSRVVGFADSSDAARAAFITAEKDAHKRGVRSLGGTASINLKLYAPAVEVVATAEPLRIAA